MALLARSSASKKPAATTGAARAADRSELFDDRFLRTLEHLHMVSRKVFTGNLRAERRTRKVGSGIDDPAEATVSVRWQHATAVYISFDES